MPVGRPRKFDYDDALDKAMHVFWEKGYEGTSMPDLTEAMSMNRPSIYAAYGNKEELFCKALDRYTQRSVEFFNTHLDKENIREAMSSLLCASVGNMSCKESPKGCLSVQGALACSDEAKIVQQYATARREKMVDILEDRFNRAKREGELPKTMDSRDLARFFITMMQGLSIQSASGVEDKALRGIAERALSVLPP